MDHNQNLEVLEAILSKRVGVKFELPDEDNRIVKCWWIDIDPTDNKIRFSISVDQAPMPDLV